jgi:hypothetical protein
MSVEGWEPETHPAEWLDYNNTTWPSVMTRAERTLAETAALLEGADAEVISLASLRAARARRHKALPDNEFPKAA